MKPKILLLTLTGTALILSLILGLSYALWMITDTQDGENLVDSDCFAIDFSEDVSTTINLANSFPMIDSDGMKSSPYQFTIENTCATGAVYNVRLEVLSTTDIAHNLIKGSVDNNAPIVMTNEILADSSIIEGASAYVLYDDYIAGNTTVSHDFRMWIDESGTVDNAANKRIDAKITVSSEASYIPYSDTVLAGSDPVLDSKMIPVNISDTGVVTVADIYEEWYNYTNSEWANAVIVDPSFVTLDPGTTIPMESIEQMYVWIPRYEYKKSSIVNSDESIEINFVSRNVVNTNIENDVIVHPAFTFGDIEQSGLWVGKFELGWRDGFIDNPSLPYNNGVDTTYLIKPNINSAHTTEVSTMYYNIHDSKTLYSLDTRTDVHMMKNTDWGAVAYLSQSQYGICEDDITCSVKIENNNYYNSSTFDIVTGCGGNDTAQSVSLSGINICPAENTWETTNGIKASTTQNITGIYDMAGGREEYVMGNMQYNGGKFYSSASGFLIAPDTKYYNSYLNGSSFLDYSRGLYGDATIELNPGGDSTSNNYVMENWNNDYALFSYSEYAWIARGGLSSYGDKAGIWVFRREYGNAHPIYTSRIVLTVE